MFFKNARTATVAASVVINAEDNLHFRVKPCPGPDEINWLTLLWSARTRELRRWLFFPAVVFFCALPIGIFAGGLQQLDYALCPNPTLTNPDPSRWPW